VYSIKIGSFQRSVRSDEGFSMCSHYGCDLLRDFRCSSLDGPTCAVMNPPKDNRVGRLLGMRGEVECVASILLISALYPTESLIKSLSKNLGDSLQRKLPR